MAAVERSQPTKPLWKVTVKTTEHKQKPGDVPP